MKSKYLPKNFEEKWIKKWEKDKVYRTSEKKDKSYVLDMFPYPSGSGLHVGHVRIYTASDVLARFFRLKGKNVLHPMGWDAFGLPAENAAIKAKKNPIDMVPKNIEVFKKQMKNLGFSYDWNREFTTSDPDYYKWTQWLFIQFFKSGLLYKKAIPVFYCESCKTGLAEEEVLANGKHERCGNEITRKTLPQWIFRINLYADELLKDLDGLDWPEGIKKMQKNWIGRSEGMDIDFKIKNPFRQSESEASQKSSHFAQRVSRDKKVKRIRVFTTRQDTIFGVTGIIIAPEHKLVEEILNNKEINIETDRNKIKKYVEEAKKKSDLVRTDLEKNKTGIFSGFYAENPVNQKKVPIWIADYVVGWYGYGAVMFVPDGDKRDFEFAKKYGLSIEKVVERENYDEPYIDEGYLLKNKDIEIFINNNDFFKKKIETKFFRNLISKKIEEKGFGKKNVQYKIRDWIFSRQRYWGEPIPMIFCQKCADAKILWWDIKVENKQKLIHDLDQDMQETLYGWFPISEKELPLKLPYIKSYEPGVFGDSPLSNAKDWMQARCPNCKNRAKRESDTMPNWAGSCWYFLAFPSWNEEKAIINNQITRNKQIKNSNDKNPKQFENSNLSIKNCSDTWKLEFGDSISKWMPVDWYIGGAEHAVLHLLYSRFWIKALHRLKFINVKEPFFRLRNVGLVIAEDKRKMSKSFGNIINPDNIISEFGADTLRITEMFMAPFSQEIAWSGQTLQGSHRFLKRVWQIVNDTSKLANDEKSEDSSVVKELQSAIRSVDLSIAKVKFNTGVSFLMTFLNSWEKSKGSGKLTKENIKKFLIILSPYAPFLTEELWESVFKEQNSIHLSNWPEVDKKLIQSDEIKLPVQINGKMRSVLLINNNLEKESVISLAKEDKRVKTFLNGEIVDVIYVKGKVLNFVVKNNKREVID